MAETAFRSVADLAATTLTSVHTFTTDGTANIRLVNRTSATITVRVAIIDGGPTGVADEDYIEYDVPLPANGVLLDTGEPGVAAEQVCAYASATGVSVRVSGWEV